MKLNWKVIWDIVGYISVILLTYAYFAISNKSVDPHGIIYQGLNIVGALGLFGLGAYRKVWPSVIFNLFWIVIGLWTLLGVR